ncbi:hypothetical protein MG290_11035 [Flavobacterium sp. CBA20B-1]|uniref:hypothetical protein n=1 Tax=unclassified Flavobacterium TaxID=196869 RepID=UPI0022240E83|nr:MULTISPECIES: hypothetical protein [unclassified Flavobacterium]WCM41481.1 hypothetical protein MG290_11035 [Flavobacterium sp. CBA20B-1]
MKKIILATLLAGCFTFNSCDKEKELTTNAVYLPAKIYGDSGPVTFKYDDKNRIVEMKEGDSNYTITTTLNYTGDLVTSAKVEEITTENTYTTNYMFTYEGGKVLISYNDDPEPVDVFSIDDKGKLIGYDGGSISYDNIGNIKKVTNPYEEYTFEYDTKNGVFKNVKTPQWVYVYLLDDYFLYMVNNGVKIEYKDLESSENHTQIIDYTYNADHFPEKIMFSNEDYYIKVEYTKK